MVNNNKDSKINTIIESTLITIASEIPIISTIATGWNEYKNYKQTQHIESLLKSYAEKLKYLEEKIDKEYLGSEDAKRLIERTVNTGKDEIRDQKREMLANFLANSCTHNLSSDTEKDMILDIIDKISPLQVSILHTITKTLVNQWGKSNVELGSNYKPESDKKLTFGYIFEEAIIQHFKLNNSIINLEASLDYLFSIGVIETASQRGWTTVGGKQGVKGFRPTKLGLKTLEYLGITLDQMM